MENYEAVLRILLLNFLLYVPMQHAMEIQNKTYWISSFNHTNPAFQVCPEVFKRLPIHYKNVGYASDNPYIIDFNANLSYERIISFFNDLATPSLLNNVSAQQIAQDPEKFFDYLVINDKAALGDKVILNIQSLLRLHLDYSPDYCSKLACAQNLNKLAELYEKQYSIGWNTAIGSATTALGAIFFKTHRAQDCSAGQSSFKRIFFSNWHGKKYMPRDVQQVHNCLMAYRKKYKLGNQTLEECGVLNGQGLRLNYTVCLAAPGSNTLLFSTTALRDNIVKLSDVSVSTITAFSISPSGNFIVSAHQDNKLILWQKDSINDALWESTCMQLSGACYKLCFHPTEKCLIALGHKNETTYVVYYKMREIQKISEYHIPTLTRIKTVVFDSRLPMGHYIIDEDNMAHLFNPREQLTSLPDHILEQRSPTQNAPKHTLSIGNNFFLEGRPYVLRHTKDGFAWNIEHILNSTLVPVGSEKNNLILMDERKNYLSINLDKLEDLIRRTHTMTLLQLVQLGMTAYGIVYDPYETELPIDKLKKSYLQALSVAQLLKAIK